MSHHAEPTPPRRRAMPYLAAGVAAVAVALGAAAYLLREPPLEEPRAAGEPHAEAVPADIETRVHAFCGACHAYPPPDSFPRDRWAAEVERGYKFFQGSRMALEPPRPEHVVRYYEDRAPQDYAPLPAGQLSPLAGQFERVGSPPAPGAHPWVSHVQAVKLPPGVVDAAALARATPTLLACDMEGDRILALRPQDTDPAWRVLGKASHPARAEVVDLDQDGILDIVVAELGSFLPTDQLLGGVVWLRGRRDGTFEPVQLLSGVGRVADVRAAAFCGSGKLDLVVAVFGLQEAGEILLLENKTRDWARPEFVRRALDPRHGTIHVPVADLDGDGRPDFVALISQEHETVVAFLNQGGGEFRKQALYAAPHPAWGSSGIELTDINGDGRLDVLYTNGDILDEPYLLKPYHGLQWLENKGGLNFEHRRVADMYGAHRAVAGRVTGGKLPDIVAVSFLPAGKFSDRDRRRSEALTLFRQVEPGKFERHCLAAGSCDAVSCCVADLYGTGREDIAIGNFSPAGRPVTVWRNPARPAK